MSNLNQNLERLSIARTDIANAIVAKGGTVGQNDGFEDFVSDIGTISSSPIMGNFDISGGYTVYTNDIHYIVLGNTLYFFGYFSTSARYGQRPTATANPLFSTFLNKDVTATIYTINTYSNNYVGDSRTITIGINNSSFILPCYYYLGSGWLTGQVTIN